MDACVFDAIVSQVADLSRQQCAHRLALLKETIGKARTVDTVRKAAAKVGGAKNTSLRWRHRFPSVTRDDRSAVLNGIAEADETFLRESQKDASAPACVSPITCAAPSMSRTPMATTAAFTAGCVVSTASPRAACPITPVGTGPSTRRVSVLRKPFSRPLSASSIDNGYSACNNASRHAPVTWRD